MAGCIFAYAAGTFNFVTSWVRAGFVAVGGAGTTVVCNSGCRKVSHFDHYYLQRFRVCYAVSD